MGIAFDGSVSIQASVPAMAGTFERTLLCFLRDGSVGVDHFPVWLRNAGGTNFLRIYVPGTTVAAGQIESDLRYGTVALGDGGGPWTPIAVRIRKTAGNITALDVRVGSMGSWASNTLSVADNMGTHTIIQIGDGDPSEAAEFFYVNKAISDVEWASWSTGAALGETLFAGNLIDWATLKDVSAGARTLQVSGIEMVEVGAGDIATSGTHPVSRATAPTVSTQPSATTVTAPATANFTAAVSGTYTGLRWQRQAAGAGAWADVVGGTGGTTTSYTTGATTVSGGSFNSTDRFRLAVDWSGGTVFSNDVALTVSAAGTAPAITVQPANQSVTIPATATFSVTATGSGTLSYQWQRQPAAGGGYSNISGANSASYTTGATALSGGSHNNGDTYRCVVTGDTSPPATSNPATLTVLAPLATSFSFTIDGAVSLTGLKFALFEHVTPDQWVAPIVKGTNETTDGSGVCTIPVTGLTARRVGELGSAIVTNSDGTPTGGSQAATRRATYYVGAFS